MPTDFLADVRKGVFQEIYSTDPKVDAYRRNLQRGYLELISTRLNGTFRANDDERPMLRGELRSLTSDLTTAMGKTTDRNTKLHLEDLRDQIAKIMDPKFQQSNGVQVAVPVFTLDGDSELAPCWPDY